MRAQGPRLTWGAASLCAPAPGVPSAQFCCCPGEESRFEPQDKSGQVIVWPLGECQGEGQWGPAYAEESGTTGRAWS